MRCFNTVQVHDRVVVAMPVEVKLRDLRAKAMTDAKRDGYTVKQISIGGAHTDEEMAESYIKLREMPVSEVVMKLSKVETK